MKKGGRLVKKIIFGVARRKSLGGLVGFAFCHLSAFIPVRRVYQSDWVFGFFHPVPFYENHILLIPKKIVRTVLDIQEETILSEVVHAAENVAQEKKFGKAFVVLVNGGTRQDVMQVHFHLFFSSQLWDMSLSGDDIQQLSIHDLLNVQYVSGGSTTLLTIALKNNDRIRSTLFEAFIQIFPKLGEIFGFSQKGSGYSIFFKFTEDGQFMDTIFLDIKTA